MQRVISILVFLLAALPFGYSQNFSPVVGSQVEDASGSLLQSGTICFQPVNAFQKPTNFLAGGGGTVTSAQVCRTVTNGVIQGTLNIASSTHTSPTGIQYAVTVTDDVAGTTMGLGTAYICTDPGVSGCQSGSWSIDQWAPTNVTTLPFAGPSFVAGALSVTGAVTAPNFHGLADSSLTSLLTGAFSVAPQGCPNGEFSNLFDTHGNSMNCQFPNGQTSTGSTAGNAALNPSGNQAILLQSGAFQRFGSNAQYSEFDSNGIEHTPDVQEKAPRVDVRHPDFGTPSTCANVADTSGTNSSSCSIQAAITYAIAHPQGGIAPTVYVPAGKYLLTAGLTISGALNVVCDKGAIFVKGGTFDAITITASNVTLDGCSVNGQRASNYGGRGVYVNSVDSVTIKGGDYSHNTTNGIYAVNVTNFVVDGVHTSDNQAESAKVDTSGAGNFGPVTIRNSVLDASLCTTNFCHAFTAHAVNTGAVYNGVSLINNTLYTNTGFCGEAFSTQYPTQAMINVNYSNNTCYSVGTSPHGFSMSEATGGTVSNNVTYVTQAAAYGAGFIYEFAQGSSNFVADSDSVMALGSASYGDAAHIDQSNHITLSNFKAYGFNKTGVLIGVSAALNGASASYNSVNDFDCNPQNSTGSIRCIWLQANTPTGNMVENSIYHTHLYGATTTSGVVQAVVLEKDSGVLDRTYIYDNDIHNWTLGVNHDGDTNTNVVNNILDSAPVGGPPGSGSQFYDPFATTGKTNYVWTSDTTDPNVCVLDVVNFGSDGQGGFMSCNSLWNGSSWVKASTNVSNNALFVKMAPTQWAVEFGTAATANGVTPGTTMLLANGNGVQATTPTLYGNVTLGTVSTPGSSILTAVTGVSGAILTDATSYCYRVAAVNTVGSTLANTEQCVTTGTSGNTNAISIQPAPTLGATSYAIYGRTTGAELLLATITAQTGIYVDTGSATTGAALPSSNTTFGDFNGSKTLVKVSTPTPSGTCTANGYVTANVNGTTVHLATCN